MERGGGADRCYNGLSRAYYLGYEQTERPAPPLPGHESAEFFGFTAETDFRDGLEENNRLVFVRERPLTIRDPNSDLGSQLPQSLTADFRRTILPICQPSSYPSSSFRPT